LTRQQKSFVVAYTVGSFSLWHTTPPLRISGVISQTEEEEEHPPIIQILSLSVSISGFYIFKNKYNFEQACDFFQNPLI
jgi:hypothetical protein